MQIIYQTFLKKMNNPFQQSNKIVLEIENNEDNFEEFEVENWQTPNDDFNSLWDENWDQTDEIDEDLSAFLKINPSAD